MRFDVVEQTEPSSHETTIRGYLDNYFQMVWRLAS